MEKEKEEIRVIHVFDNAEDAANEMVHYVDGSYKDPDMDIAVSEKDVLMNVLCAISCNNMKLVRYQRMKWIYV